jgi:hypothetical protein
MQDYCEKCGAENLFKTKMDDKWEITCGACGYSEDVVKVNKLVYVNNRILL